jgi:cation:H+ antiporter
MIGLSLIFGMFFLYLGAELLVKGAARLALSFGVSSLVVGLTVVAAGTSTPEVVASLVALLNEESGDIALGNVIGSNSFNIGFILGLLALCHPLKISHLVKMHDVPVMILTALALYLVLFSGEVTRAVSLLFLLGFVTYVLYRLRIKDPNVVEIEKHEELVPKESFFIKEVFVDLFFILFGILLLVFGGSIFVHGAVEVAKLFGVSQRVIGLTIVAMGTSLPELVTSAVALLRKHYDIAIGNIVGSNIFNILFILGVVGAVRPFSFSESLLAVDTPVMVGFTFLLWLMVRRRLALSRLSGAILLGLYSLYIFLLLQSPNSKEVERIHINRSITFLR